MELFELEEEELIEKIDAVDLNALLENSEIGAAEIPIIRFKRIFMDREGDTVRQLIAKQKSDSVLFIKRVTYTDFCDPDLDSAETDGFYLDGEEAMKLYKLLATEVNAAQNTYEEVDSSECAFVTTKDGDDEWDEESEPIPATPTVFAIFKKFVAMATEQCGDDYGAAATYDWLLSDGTYLV